jgi:hypothetical protein
VLPHPSPTLNCDSIRRLLCTTDGDTSIVNDPRVLSRVSEILQTEAVCEVSRFYDRDPKITDWYYQMYAGSEISEGSIRNDIAESVTSRRVHGGVLIMKNGPLGGEWASEPEIQLDDLVKMLWWYKASGRDAATVCSERVFERLCGIDPVCCK